MSVSFIFATGQHMWPLRAIAPPCDWLSSLDSRSPGDDEAKITKTKSDTEWKARNHSLKNVAADERSFSACSSFSLKALFFQFWHAEAHLMLDVVLPPVHGTVGRPPWFKIILIQYVLEHTVIVQLLCPVLHVLFLHRLSATGGFKLSEDSLFLSHSYLTQCRRPRSTTYCHINRHSLVEWLHNCSYDLQIFGSQYLNPVFEETVLTIACTDLRKKKSFWERILWMF